MSDKQKKDQQDKLAGQELLAYYEAQRDRWQQKYERRIHAPKKRAAQRRVTFYEGKIEAMNA